MELTTRQQNLLELVKQLHAGQERKWTGMPYWTHPYSVATRVQSLPLGIEVAFCHDLIEDVDGFEFPDLIFALTDIGYSNAEALMITHYVLDLSDVYTKEAYPHLNRKERKLLEAQRLSEIDHLPQSVKYSDMIDNVPCVAENGRGFARVYIPEKKMILASMTAGDEGLRVDALLVISKAEIGL